MPTLARYVRSSCIHRRRVFSAESTQVYRRLLAVILLHCVIALVLLVNDIAADPAVSAIVKLEPGFTVLRYNQHFFCTLSLCQLPA